MGEKKAFWVDDGASEGSPYHSGKEGGGLWPETEC